MFCLHQSQDLQSVFPCWLRGIPSFLAAICLTLIPLCRTCPELPLLCRSWPRGGGGSEQAMPIYEDVEYIVSVIMMMMMMSSGLSAFAQVMCDLFKSHLIVYLYLFVCIIIYIQYYVYTVYIYIYTHYIHIIGTCTCSTCYEALRMESLAQSFILF